jgi:hypothetical protein
MEIFQNQEMKKGAKDILQRYPYRFIDTKDILQEK